MREGLRAILFLAILGGACGAVMTAAHRLLPKPQASYAERERIRAILRALDVPIPPGASTKTLLAAFGGNVRTEQRGDLTVYLLSPLGSGDEIKAVAVPFSGPGLHGPIRGIVSFEPDARTLRTVVVYEHNEMPDLGAQIETTDFSRRFRGKAIETGGRAPIRLVRTPMRPNEVHAVTGATMTSGKVQQMLNRTIRRFHREWSRHAR